MTRRRIDEDSPPKSVRDSPLLADFHELALLDFVMPRLSGEIILAPLSESTDHVSLSRAAALARAVDASASLNLSWVLGCRVREGAGESIPKSFNARPGVTVGRGRVICFEGVRDNASGGWSC